MNKKVMCDCYAQAEYLVNVLEETEGVSLVNLSDHNLIVAYVLDFGVKDINLEEIGFYEFCDWEEEEY